MLLSWRLGECGFEFVRVALTQLELRVMLKYVHDGPDLLVDVRSGRCFDGAFDLDCTLSVVCANNGAKSNTSSAVYEGVKSTVCDVFKIAVRRIANQRKRQQDLKLGRNR